MSKGKSSNRSGQSEVERWQGSERLEKLRVQGLVSHCKDLSLSSEVEESLWRGVSQRMTRSDSYFNRDALAAVSL